MNNAAQRALDESPTGWAEANKTHAPLLSKWVEERLMEGVSIEDIFIRSFMEYEGLFLMSSDVAEKTIEYTITDYKPAL